MAKPFVVKLELSVNLCRDGNAATFVQGARNGEMNSESLETCALAPPPRDVRTLTVHRLEIWGKKKRARCLLALGKKNTPDVGSTRFDVLGNVDNNRSHRKALPTPPCELNQSSSTRDKVVLSHNRPLMQNFHTS